MRPLLIPLLCSLVLSPPAPADPTFSVTIDPALQSEPATGRLIVLLIRDGAALPRGAEPLDGPFWDDPQPLYAIDVRALPPGAAATIDDTATSFPVKLSELPAGSYRAQARLDTARLTSNWRSEPGNLYSDAVAFTIPAPAGPDKPNAIEIRLTRRTDPKPPAPATAGAELFEIRSDLLSRFHHRNVMLRAGVAFPVGYKPDGAPGRAYAAVYEVPGFGGDASDAFGEARARARLPADSPPGQLARHAFHIVLDPESPNGHTLLANSANNGPRADALIHELLPALEAKYNLIAHPSARLLRGHSSGGWSVLWLALNYPDTFGAAWSSSPDPVDFRRLQRTDIYAEPSMYTTSQDQSDTPSYRRGGGRAGVTMTVRQENLMEEVIGPDNTSAQQWDSWFAVFGPRRERTAEDGGHHPAPLFDPRTGLIDRAVAEQYKKYDLGELVRRHPGTLGLLFHQRLRLVVGDQDNFYLNEAVALLKADVDALSFLHYPEGRHGHITILPGYDHGSIARGPEVLAFPQDMLDHLRRAGHAPTAER